MRNNVVHFTLRIDRQSLDKLGYIAEYEGRTKNKELAYMVRKRIAAFEKDNGAIELNNEATMICNQDNK